MWRMPPPKVRSGMRTLDLKPIPELTLWEIVQLVTSYHRTKGKQTIASSAMLMLVSCFPPRQPNNLEQTRKFHILKTSLISKHPQPLPPRHIHIRLIIKPRLQKLPPLKTPTLPHPINLQILKQITRQHRIINIRRLNLSCFPSQGARKELLEGEIEVYEDCDGVGGGGG